MKVCNKESCQARDFENRSAVALAGRGLQMERLGTVVHLQRHMWRGNEDEELGAWLPWLFRGCRSRNIAVSPVGGTPCEAHDKVEVAPCGRLAAHL